MYMETEQGRKMYLIRITSYDALFADAVRFPGRGVFRDGVWKFPEEGMPKKQALQPRPWWTEEATR